MVGLLPVATHVSVVEGLARHWEKARGAGGGGGGRGAAGGGGVLLVEPSIITAAGLMVQVPS